MALEEQFMSALGRGERPSEAARAQLDLGDRTPHRTYDLSHQLHLQHRRTILAPRKPASASCNRSGCRLKGST